jgi:hypothetical protein
MSLLERCQISGGIKGDGPLLVDLAAGAVVTAGGLVDNAGAVGCPE